MKGVNLPEKPKQDTTFCNDKEANNDKKIPPKGDVDELIFPDNEPHYISER